MTHKWSPMSMFQEFIYDVMELSSKRTRTSIINISYHVLEAAGEKGFLLAYFLHWSFCPLFIQQVEMCVTVCVHTCMHVK